jgi:hypothetical protein
MRITLGQPNGIPTGGPTSAFGVELEAELLAPQVNPCYL